MLIEWAIPCRYAERRDGTVNLLGAGTDTFRLQGEPAELSLWLALRITAGAHEFGESELIAVQVLDPDMLVRELTALGLHHRDYPGRDETRHPALIATVPVRFDVRMAGLHALHLRLKDRLTTVSLFVLEP